MNPNPRSAMNLTTTPSAMCDVLSCCVLRCDPRDDHRPVTKRRPCARLDAPRATLARGWNEVERAPAPNTGDWRGPLAGELAGGEHQCTWQVVPVAWNA